MSVQHINCLLCIFALVATTSVNSAPIHDSGHMALQVSANGETPMMRKDKAPVSLAEASSREEVLLQDNVALAQKDFSALRALGDALEVPSTSNLSPGGSQAAQKMLEAVKKEAEQTALASQAGQQMADSSMTQASAIMQNAQAQINTTETQVAHFYVNKKAAAARAAQKAAKVGISATNKTNSSVAEVLSMLRKADTEAQLIKASFQSKKVAEDTLKLAQSVNTSILNMSNTLEEFVTLTRGEADSAAEQIHKITTEAAEKVQAVANTLRTFEEKAATNLEAKTTASAIAENASLASDVIMAKGQAWASGNHQAADLTKSNGHDTAEELADFAVHAKAKGDAAVRALTRAATQAHHDETAAQAQWKEETINAANVLGNAVSTADADVSVQSVAKDRESDPLAIPARKRSLMIKALSVSVVMMMAVAAVFFKLRAINLAKQKAQEEIFDRGQ